MTEPTKDELLAWLDGAQWAEPIDHYVHHESDCSLCRRKKEAIRTIIEQHFAPPDEAVKEALEWVNSLKFELNPETGEALNLHLYNIVKTIRQAPERKVQD